MLKIDHAGIRPFSRICDLAILYTDFAMFYTKKLRSFACFNIPGHELRTATAPESRDKHSDDDFCPRQVEPRRVREIRGSKVPIHDFGTCADPGTVPGAAATATAATGTATAATETTATAGATAGAGATAIVGATAGAAATACTATATACTATATATVSRATATATATAATATTAHNICEPVAQSEPEAAGPGRRQGNGAQPQPPVAEARVKGCVAACGSGWQ
jgi:hypothetical protein